MSELSEEEIKTYEEALRTAIKIVNEVYGGPSSEIIGAVFEKIASPLVYLRQDIAKEKEALQGGFSHETPGVNEAKVPENESGNKGDTTIGYERKARLLKEGWKEMPKYPNIVFKTAGNLTFFEDTRDGRSWISKHAEVEK